MAPKHTATFPEGPTGDFKGDIRVDNVPPTPKEIKRAGEIEVFDKDKKAHKFSSLLASPNYQKHTHLVVFIRHFFCGNCQEYTRLLSEILPANSLPSNTSVIIIGCGNPVLIDQYLNFTSSAYPIYADPSKQLYNHLRMTRTLDLGQVMPKYMSHTSIKKLALRSIWQELSAGRRMLSGGDFWQVGGEFVFETDESGNTEATWCHRMKNTRDHAEIDDVKAALGMGHADASDSDDTIAAQKSDQQKTKKRWSSVGGLSRRFSLRASQTTDNGDGSPKRRQSTRLTKRSTWTARGNVNKPPSPGAVKEAEQERKVLEQLKEEGPEKGDDTEDALAKLTGGATGQQDGQNSVPNEHTTPIDNGGSTEKPSHVDAKTDALPPTNADNLAMQNATELKSEDSSPGNVPLPALTEYQKEASPIHDAPVPSSPAQQPAAVAAV